MNNQNEIEHTAQSAAHLKTNFVLGYYLITIVTSTVILFVHGRLAFAADLFAGLCYLAVTAVLYDLSHQNGIRTLQKQQRNGMPHVSPSLRDMGTLALGGERTRPSRIVYRRNRADFSA